MRERPSGRIAHSVGVMRQVLTGVHRQVLVLRDELSGARNEIAGLKAKLAQRRLGRGAIPDMDLGTLRRRVAFHCHPDRGGDAILMRNLNMLFDALDSLT